MNRSWICVDWCEENDLVWMNRFKKHWRRGTWFSNRFHRSNELEGFVVRKRDRVGLGTRICGASKWGLSNHMLECVRVRLCMKKWRSMREGRGYSV